MCINDRAFNDAQVITINWALNKAINRLDRFDLNDHDIFRLLLAIMDGVMLGETNYLVLAKIALDEFDIDIGASFPCG